MIWREKVKEWIFIIILKGWDFLSNYLCYLSLIIYSRSVSYKENLSCYYYFANLIKNNKVIHKSIIITFLTYILVIPTKTLA